MIPFKGKIKQKQNQLKKQKKTKQSKRQMRNPATTPRVPESIILNIFSFYPSFVFFNHCKSILKYDIATTINLIGKYYFQKVNDKAQIGNHLFLEYFMYHKHLLILDNYPQFESYLRENYWVKELCLKNPNDKIIHSSLRNIIRLSYFVKCLRELAKYQRQNSIDKIEQTNIGVSYQYLIENINSESESQTRMLKHYMKYKNV